MFHHFGDVRETVRRSLPLAGFQIPASSSLIVGAVGLLEPGIFDTV